MSLREAFFLGDVRAVVAVSINIETIIALLGASGLCFDDGGAE